MSSSPKLSRSPVWVPIKEMDRSQRMPLPGHGSCYVCGRDNPMGIGARFYHYEDSVISEIKLGTGQQGAPGFAHGGALAALLDEAMGSACWLKHHMVMSAKIEVNYRRPVPLGEAFQLHAWVDSEEGRKVWAAGCLITRDGAVLTDSRGLFIEARKNFVNGTPSF